MALVLIVEDDHLISNLIKKNLSLVGHTCLQAADGLQALGVIEEHRPELILLDVMLPYLSGFDLIEKIKDIPIIFITAKDSLEDRVKGLRLGAEDYIVKPFEMLELLARVDVVLRRYRKGTEEWTSGDVTVNFDTQVVKKQDEVCELTHQEYLLLETLIKNRNVVLSREKLLELAWGYDYGGDSRTVDVHIQRLRKKLGWSAYIKTVYKSGYRLEV